MISIGITGGIGSGKSFVCRILGAMSIPIYDCDQRAKALYDDSAELKGEMIRRFGAELYNTPEGKLNRAMLADIVFKDNKQLAELNALVHPLVRADIDIWLKEQSQLRYPLALIESAILFASEGLLSRIDYSIAVLAPEALRIERAIARDNSPRIDIERRIKAQMSDDELAKRADFTITNDGKKHLLPQIEDILGCLPIH